MSKAGIHVAWTETAWADIDDMLAWQKAQGTDFATLETYVQHIINGAKYLASFPKIGRVGVVDGTREWVVKRTPYYLVYAEHEDGIAILRVIHGKRKYPDSI